MSELASQRFEALKLRRKLHDDVLKSIFVHVGLLGIGNFCIHPSILTSQYICLRSYQLVNFLHSILALSSKHIDYASPYGAPVLREHPGVDVETLEKRSQFLHLRYDEVKNK
jgi:hypothetical protein